jgi:integrase
MKKRFEGDFNHVPHDPLLLASEGAQAPGIGLPQQPVLEIAASAPLFSERAKEYREKRLRLKSWEGQTALQARKTYELFAEVCDDRPIAGYTRQDAVRFIRLLQELPADYGKAPRYRGMTIVDIVAAVKDDLELPRLSSRTVQRHHHALSALWADELEAGTVEDTIFGDFKFPSAKRATEQRDHWPREKLAKLFESPVWRGCKSDVRRSKPGNQIIRDEKFWIPLIGLFSGMRQEEICQLFVNDIRQEGDIWVFDVNDAGPRQLKNATARRLVPIHRELILMGLLTRVEALKEAGSERLFPELKPGGADDRLGHNFSKWFTRYRKDIGVYERWLDFHSLRHTATTLMEQADVPRPIVAAIDGHVVPGETSRYMKGFKIDQLKQAIDLLDAGIDLSFLYESTDA